VNHRGSLSCSIDRTCLYIHIHSHTHIFITLYAAAYTCRRSVLESHASRGPISHGYSVTHLQGDACHACHPDANVHIATPSRNRKCIGSVSRVSHARVMYSLDNTCRGYFEGMHPKFPIPASGMIAKSRSLKCFPYFKRDNGYS